MNTFARRPARIRSIAAAFTLIETSIAVLLATPPSTLPAYERTNMMLITVAANLNSGRMPRSRTMQTYVAKYGVQRYVVGN